MKTIFESRNCIVEYDGNDTVYKTLKQTKISHDWLENYNQVRDNNPRYVEVYEVIDNETLAMEYIDELDTLEYVLKEPHYWPQINKHFIIEALETFHQAFTDGLRVSKHHGNEMYFMHTDLKVANLIVDKDMRVMIIDPDSYTWVPKLQWTEKYYINQINMMFCLQRYFYENV